MKKLLAFFAFLLLFSLVVAGSAQAVSMYLWWPDGSTTDAQFIQGETVFFNYTGIGPGDHQIKTEIFRTEIINPSNNELLFYDVSFGGTWGDDSFSTEGLVAGTYAISGFATDLETGYQDTAYLFFDLIEDPTNHPPEFDGDLQLSYSYNIDLGNVDVVDLADFSFDLDNDELYYSVDQSNTNTGIIDCDIVSDSVLNCDLNGVGNSTVDVIVSDGMDSDTATISIEVYEDAPVNHPPEFTDDLQLFYSYNILLGNVDVVDLADYSFDLDNDELFYYVDESNTNLGIVNCDIVSDSILNCDLNGVGNSTVDVVVSDSYATDVATISIEVYEDVSGNHPPEFTDDLQLYYLVNIDDSPVVLVDLADYSFDLDNDELFYYVDESNTNTNIADCAIISESQLFCVLSSVGNTSLDVIVSDLQDNDVATITIEVYEDAPTNHPPEFTDDLQLHYIYNLSEDAVTVVDLADFSFDLDNDDLYYYVDESNTNFNVVDCMIISDSELYCDLVGVGNTSVDVIVTDLQDNDIATITIEVVDECPCNQPPEFTANLSVYYEFNINLANVNVVDLAQFSFDPDDDDLEWFIDQTNTDFSVIDCQLLPTSSSSQSETEFPTGATNNAGSGIEQPAPTSTNSILNCDLNGVGTTTVNAIVSDGDLQDEVTLTIHVFEDNSSNNPPEFTDDLQLNYTYNINLVNVDVVDLADYSFDLDNDELFYFVNEYNTNPNVVNCDIVSDSVLNCDLTGVGTTTLDVIVTDNQDYDVATITITVFEEGNNNTAPYFQNLQLFYSYPLNMSQANVVDLSQYAYDDEFDTVTFSLDQSNTDFSVVNCSLVQSTFIGVPPTPFQGPNMVTCDFNGVGMTTVDVAVSDGEFTSWVTLIIEVYDDSGNQPPYFVGLQSYYSYNIDLGDVYVVDLATHSIDPDGDELSYLLDESNTNLNIVDCDLVQDPTGPINGPESFLHCDLNNVGVTSVRVGITDGYYVVWETIVIHVYELGGNNTAPYFDNSMQLYYSFNIDSALVNVVDLAAFAHDDELDTVTFSLDQSATDLSVVDCHLEATNSPFPTNPYQGPNMVVCELNGVGTTTLRATVSDGELSTYAILTINVYSIGPGNTAPYLGNDINGNPMNLQYSYDLNLVSQADVVHLGTFGNDDEGDTVSFTLDQSLTDSSVAVCSLVNGPDVASPTPYVDPAMLHCVFTGLGTTTVDVIISDGALQSVTRVTITTYQSQSISPVAIISSPGTSGFEGESATVDGSQSYSPIGLDIVDYQWTITDVYGNQVYSVNYLSSFPYLFSEGTYTIALTVVDSAGNTGSTTKTYKVYVDPSSDDRPEEGLKVVTYDVYGFDYERVELGGDLTITAWLENQAGEDLDGVRMTYTIPEFGIRYTSQAISIDAGDREYIQIHTQIPCCDVDPGVYYPYISFSDGDIRRVKTGYLEVHP